ncbi:unnamed protein product [Durusdinium trenchii]|uniref:RING-type domain-containing protein n=1 Tax=Durusdinium trenchii TaxID=1381693 RepID=A0ABP0S5K0_9DINO
MVFDSFFIVVMCFCSIFTVLLLMFFFIGLLRFLTGSCHGEIRVSSHAELTEEERRDLEKAIQEHLPDVKVDKGDGEEHTCPVCLDDIEPCEHAKKLKCNHIYHTECIMEWCTKKRRKEGDKRPESVQCPVCRCHHYFKSELIVINDIELNAPVPMEV